MVVFFIILTVCIQAAADEVWKERKIAKDKPRITFVVVGKRYTNDFHIFYIWLTVTLGIMCGSSQGKGELAIRYPL